jgi:hypothetical protein
MAKAPLNQLAQSKTPAALVNVRLTMDSWRGIAITLIDPAQRRINGANWMPELRMLPLFQLRSAPNHGNGYPAGVRSHSELRRLFVDPHLAVSGLRDHLRCLESQNWRNQHGSSFSLYFEDSDVCCKSPFLSCRSSRCTLIHFVPEESRGEPTPCRHIRLDERGETLHSFYAKAAKEQTHAAVRDWLVSTIAMLDSENCVANKKAA